MSSLVAPEAVDVLCGWQQEERYTHPDRHDEDVEDLSWSQPFARALGARSSGKVTNKCPTDSCCLPTPSAVHYSLPESVFHPQQRLLQFLILGDPNAGKTTFLHLISSGNISSGESLLRIRSFIPIIHSSFKNLRWASEGSTTAELCDEPPFLDSDLARASITLAEADLLVFCSEFNIAPTILDDVLTKGAGPLALSFTELGGDHVDRLDSLLRDRPACDLSQRHDPKYERFVESATRNSLQLLQNTRNIVYFVNMSSLFLTGCTREENGGVGGIGGTRESSNVFRFSRWRVNEAMFRRLLQRLCVLATTAVSDQLRLQILCSRIPEDCNLSELDNPDLNIVDPPLDEDYLVTANMMAAVVDDSSWKSLYGFSLRKPNSKACLAKHIRRCLEHPEYEPFNTRTFSWTPFTDEYGQELATEFKSTLNKLRRAPSMLLLKSVLAWMFELDDGGDTPTTTTTHSSSSDDSCSESRALVERLALINVDVARNLERTWSVGEDEGEDIVEGKIVPKWTVFAPGVVSTFASLLAAGPFMPCESLALVSDLVPPCGDGASHDGGDGIGGLLLRDTGMLRLFVRLLEWWKGAGMVTTAVEQNDRSNEAAVTAPDHTATLPQLNLWLSSGTLAQFLEAEQGTGQDDTDLVDISPFTAIAQWPRLCSTLAQIGAAPLLDSFTTGLPPLKVTLELRRRQRDESCAPIPEAESQLAADLVSLGTDVLPGTNYTVHAKDSAPLDASFGVSSVTVESPVSNEGQLNVRLPYSPRVFSFVHKCMASMSQEIRPVAGIHGWRSLAAERVPPLILAGELSTSRNETIDPDVALLRARECFLREIVATPTTGLGPCCSRLLKVLAVPPTGVVAEVVDAAAALLHSAADFATAVMLTQTVTSPCSGCFPEKCIAASAPTACPEVWYVEGRLISAPAANQGWSTTGNRLHVRITAWINPETAEALDQSNWKVILSRVVDSDR